MESQNQVPLHARVRVTAINTTGLWVTERHLNAMKLAEGTVIGWVPGHGGDVWWVQHDDGSVGAYYYTDLEYVTAPEVPETYTFPVELL